MTNGLVLLIEVGLLALLLVLAFRMLTLVRTDPFVAATTATYPGPISETMTEPSTGRNRMDIGNGTTGSSLDKCGLISQLHILLSIQERDCRENGLDIDRSPDVVKEYVAAWLYGAACALCDKPQRHSDALVNLVSQMISRKVGLRQPAAVQSLSTLTGSSTLLACFRYGVDGAEYWSEHRYVPAANSLYGAVTSNAFI
ncbi:hypothetical protein QPM17_00195 [Marinobacter sp. TBZ242]|uniref:Uncharacterized protein n=1 Tax=Marinobacter azerbaijanicus TaxID=3050455 RepID=A0ABT7I633_9GAMM|nr:hypothetical protein [Marinobacter sp. TBZ242]MDL0429531.1 hypothetical protein [Marinobacter sp. TBZ242]